MLQKYYVTPDMQGSYSIKYVLPALVPQMAKAYTQLDSIQNGSEAMNAFANLPKTYVCELYTLVTVRVFVE